MLRRMNLVSRVDGAENRHAHETRATTFSAEQGRGGGNRHGSGQKVPDIPLGPWIGPQPRGKYEDDFGSSCRARSHHLPAECSMDVLSAYSNPNFRSTIQSYRPCGAAACSKHMGGQFLIRTDKYSTNWSTEELALLPYS